MPRRRRWTDEQLRAAVRASRSYAGVIRCLGLVPAGGNYDQVRHINGDRTDNRIDNRIENLRILCPNCHSLQSTHRGLNRKSRRS